jgi:hypothetical protein
MSTLNDKAGSLYTYVDKSSKLGDLKAYSKRLENKLDTIDANLKMCELLDCPHTADRLAEQYNEVNLTKIKVDLEINAIEKDLLEFELEAATAE